MRTIILSAFTCLLCVSVHAQYLKVVEEGKTWNMLYHNEEAIELYPDYEYKYFIEGDTLIQDKEYKKLYAFNENGDKATTYKMALCENDEKVYFIPDGDMLPYVLYDFDISLGNTFVVSDPVHPQYWNIEMNVNEERFVLDSSSEQHRIFRVSRVLEGRYHDESPDRSGWWIEGVGSELGLLNTWGFGAMGNNNYLLSCTLNGQIIFESEQFQKNLKEDYAGLIDVICISEDAVYDLTGREINESFNVAPGIYIRNGRKVLKK